jgi:hypothetical protein
MWSRRVCREQVADDWREAKTLRDVAQDQRGAKAAGERQDEVVGMHVGSKFIARRAGA